MPAFDVVLIAASQGGLAACREVLEPLPADFPAAVIYAQHRSPGNSVAAVELMRRWCSLDVRVGVDGAPLEPGTVTVPPADVDVGVSAARTLTLGRPAAPGELADRLFVSAAAVYGSRTLAVVLSGRLRDATKGVRAVAAHGGRVLAQDPAGAEQGSMPWNAMATGCVDLVLDLPHLAAALVALVSVPGAAELFAVRAGSWATA